MAISPDKQADKRSAELLGLWADRTGLHRDFMRQEMIENRELDGEVSDRTFAYWFTRTRVTAENRDRVGKRVVAIVEYLASNRTRWRKVIVPQELEEFIDLYTFIPAVYRLQLRRLLYELYKDEGQKYTDVFTAKDWRKLFSEWKTFSFVMDRFYCIRAISRYNMELAGLREEDAKHWYWWHRFALGTRKKPKFAGEHTLLDLRGVYADEYYVQQLLRFLTTIHEHQLQSTKRYSILIGLLNDIDTSGNFKRLWIEAEELFKAGTQFLAQVPVPFFRSDRTLLWMLEVSAPIPQTEYVLTARLETDDVETEYLADIRRQTDTQNKGKDTALFIEDFTRNFSRDERIALGIEE